MKSIKSLNSDPSSNNNRHRMRRGLTIWGGGMEGEWRNFGRTLRVFTEKVKEFCRRGVIEKGNLG